MNCSRTNTSRLNELVRKPSPKLKVYKLDILDGEIGKVKEFYFDDKYDRCSMVAGTGNWLRQKVLISPYALRAVNKEKQKIVIDLTEKRSRTASLIGISCFPQFEEYYYVI